MRPETKAILVGCLIVVLAVVSLLLIMSSSKTFVFTQNLQMGAFQPSGPDGIAGGVYQNGTETSDVYIRADSIRTVYGSMYVDLTINIWHSEGVLDSLHLRFSSPAFLHVYLEMPEGYPWNPISFHQDTDGTSVIMAVDDLGFQGEGSIDLNFLVTSFQNLTSLQLDIQYSMHIPAFIQLTHQVVSTTATVPING